MRVPGDLDGERVDRVVARLGDMSRATARRLVEAGDVRVQGRVVAPSARLSAGDEVVFTPAPPEKLSAEDIHFRALYEDGHLAVVDKPAGIVVHPGAGQRGGTLVSGLLHRYPSIEGVGQPGRWGIVHRLDRDTSGLMAVALSPEGYESLARQVRSHSMGREYLALVDGAFAVPTGTIEAPIARDPARPTRRRVSPEGRPARSHYEVVEQFPAEGLTLVRVSLETGRTHQIRVHMAAIDHPLVGDRLYRGGPDRIETPRLFLHATTLELDHPATGRRLHFDSDLPPDLGRVLSALQR